MSDTPKILDAPEMIWLNYGDIEQACTHDECYRDGDITWCADSVFDSDVKYVRADRIAALEAKVRELETEREAEKAFQEDVEATHRITLREVQVAMNKELTASRQQVERLVEALTTEAGELNLIRACLDGFQECIPKSEALAAVRRLKALAAVENERGNA